MSSERDQRSTQQQVLFEGIKGSITNLIIDSCGTNSHLVRAKFIELMQSGESWFSALRGASLHAVELLEEQRGKTTK